MSKPSSKPSFSVGQVWKYKTRPNESDSRLTIVSIDHDDPEYGDIVHIYISELNIPNPSAPDGKTLFISHLPYLSESLAECVAESNGPAVENIAEHDAPQETSTVTTSSSSSVDWMDAWTLSMETITAGSFGPADGIAVKSAGWS